VGNGGAAALAGSAWASNLRELRLVRCHIGEDGLAALLRSPHLGRLEKLSLARNEIRGQTDALLDPFVLPALVECDLSDNPLPRSEAERLKGRWGVRV
jgi:hypothetical protein